MDGEDLPLSIVREQVQDSALIKKIRNALTRKFINHITTMARKNPSKYKDEFYTDMCQGYEFQEPLSKLL